MDEKEIEEYFDKHIKPHLIDEDMVKCKGCGIIYLFEDKKALVTYIKHLEGKILCISCAKSHTIKKEK